MNLDTQIKILIERSPNDGVTDKIMAQAVAPVLRAFAEQMQHLDYYVVQTTQQGWVLTTLSNRNQPGLEKKVIYAFAALKDAREFQGTSDPNLVAIAIPVTHILFQLFALSQVDSLVFMEKPGDLSQGKEVKREDFTRLVQEYIKNLGNLNRFIPPDLA